MIRPACPPRRAEPPYRRLKTALIAPCVGALCSTAIWAQTGPTAPPAPTGAAATAAASQAGDDAEKLETVTVTATRRREPLRDVPLRVETLNVDKLERAGATSVADYVGTLPGVDVSSDGGPGRGQVSIRGINVGAFGTATVGTYVDEVAFGSSTSFVGLAVMALDMSLLDLNHIELLRGPQGTLYGAGAMGGLLKYVTNEPDSYDLSGKAGVGLRSAKGGALGHTENAVLNVPLSEGVAGLRAAVFNDHDGGYIKATGGVTGDHVNDGDTRGGRVSLLVEPVRKLKLRLTATQQNIERNGTAIVQYDIATGKPMYGDLTHKLATPEPYHVNIDLVSSDVEYDFGWARLNVIASSQRFGARDVLDGTDIFASPAFDFVELDNQTRLRKNTQEVRLTSSRGTFEWLLGAYHDKETGLRDQRLWAQLAADQSALTLVTVAQPSSYEENAVYGDVTYNPTADLSFTLGARVARNEQAYETLTNGVHDFPVPLSSTDTSRTYLLTGRYSLDKSSSVYARIASGYRPGGPNPPAIDENGQVIPGAPTSFDPDTLWSYELGYKADLLAKRLSIEAALFDIRWDKFQQPLAIGATTLTTNASKAEVRGFELASRYAVDDHWTVDGSLALTDAKLTEDAPSLGPAGSRMPNTAKFAATLGGRYAFSMAERPMHVSLQVRHVGQRNAGFDRVGSSVPNYSLPAYTMVDGQWGMELGAWQLSAFVRNLTDERAQLGADTALTAFGGPLRVTPAQPRTIGMTLGLAF